MSRFSSTNDGCKGLFSGLSPYSRLSGVSSQITSRRSLKGGFIRSPGCAALAVFFFILTCRVVLAEVLVHGAEVTTDHYMTFGVLVGTFASGHLFWKTLWEGRVLSALGLALLFAAGTWYCVTTSAGRNALDLLDKADANATANNAREAVKRKFNAAGDDRDRARKAWEDAKSGATAAAEAQAAECGSGKKTKCGGKAFNAEQAAKREADRKKEYEAAEATIGSWTCSSQAWLRRRTNTPRNGTRPRCSRGSLG